MIISAGRPDQEFFGSFFQKRTASLRPGFPAMRTRAIIAALPSRSRLGLVSAEFLELLS
jgi:hypothetical protein